MGTKFTTTAPDGDTVDVIITKVHKVRYDIEWENIEFDVEVQNGQTVKEVNHKIFNHMANFIRDEFNGVMTTQGEQMCLKARSNKRC